MILKWKNILSVGFILSLMFMEISCGDQPDKNQKAVPEVVSKRISRPVVAKPGVQPEKKTAVQKKKDAAPLKKSVPDMKLVTGKKVAAHYDAKGKIDPFRPLVQERPESRPAVSAKNPPRILTPLEKIELSQIRLVAVIVMKNKRIAMVEEASGKGYEVGIGTYIGKNQGRITQIKDSSIVVKEPVKDYRGKLSERIQEIKLHKNEIED